MPNSFGDIVSDVRTAFTAFREVMSESRAMRLKSNNRGEGVDHGTRQDVHKQTEIDLLSGMWRSMLMTCQKADDIPPRGTYAYMMWADDLWKEEPILSGAVYSMEAKMSSMTWRVEGGKIGASKSAHMFARARHLSGNDWTGFCASEAIDFYTQDNGVWIDVTRQSEPYGQMIDIATIDTRNCLLTGNANAPMFYSSSVLSQELWYKPWQYIHFASMPLPNERTLGLGYCAVSRAARAAKLLMALHDYDAEKLSNLPPEGVAAVTGLTDREFRQAIRIWLEERKKNNSLTFPQVLWLIGNNPNAKVTIDIQSFSSIPESFTRQTVIQQYVNTLALCFGVDTREFWAISSGALGTASETEVQHLKARGKGGGEFIALMERHLNAELPPGVTFAFDTQDIEEDMVAAGVAQAWIDAYFKLAFPGEGNDAVIDAETYKRLLADRGVLPEWAVGDKRVSIASGEVHKEFLEDLVRFVYTSGRLVPTPIILQAAATEQFKQLADPGSAKQQPDLPPIKGTPIADSEVERGAKVTRKSIESELKFWKTIPELAPYVEEVSNA
jgi:hypothetical protein